MKALAEWILKHPDVEIAVKRSLFDGITIRITSYSHFYNTELQLSKEMIRTITRHDDMLIDILDDMYDQLKRGIAKLEEARARGLTERSGRYENENI